MASSSSSGLSPPSSPVAPTLRTRASSSNMRPALTLPTLGSRKRSNSMLLTPQEDSILTETSVLARVDASPEQELPQPFPSATFEPHLIPTQSEPPSGHGMLPIVVTRALQLLQLGYRHPNILVQTPPSPSPRSSTDTILPLSAPPDRTTFDAVFSEKSSRIRAGRSWRTNPSVHAPILFVIIMFPLSTALVLMALSTLPISVSWPRNITDLAQLGRELNAYTQSGSGATAHVIGVMAATAVWKHAWSIPGSVLWNVLAGALFTPAFATLLLTTLTTIGSLCATLLAMPLEPLITQFFPRALNLTRTALEGNSEGESAGKKQQSPAWVRLTILRLIGVVPWSGLNIACGVCRVSLFDCALGSFIGTLPWTAVTCQIGDILQTVASQPSPTPQTISSLVASPEIIAKLVFLSFLSLAPILGRDRLRAMLTSRDAPAVEDVERVGRWAWVRDWRVRIRSRSRTRGAQRVGQGEVPELALLVQEKEQLQMAP